MRTRRQFLIAVAAGVLPAPLAGAQQAGRVYRIGVLLNRDVRNTPGYEVFPEALRNADYAEGRNLSLSVQGTELFEDLPQLAADIIRMKPDLVVTYGTPPLAAAKKATQTIPIVGVAMGEPERYVASLARPGGNITGNSTLNADLAGKRLDVLKQGAPKLSRIAVLWNPLNPAHPAQVKTTQAAAATLRMTVRTVELRRFDDFQAATEAIVRERVEALVLLPDGVASSHQRAFTDFALARRILLVGTSEEWARNGALMSYSPDFRELWRGGAIFVDKILKGAKPADLPVEQPTKYKFVINLKTAKALGLTISRDLVFRADEVIE